MSKGDVPLLSSVVALDPTCSDYDLWRAIKTLDDELYRMQRQRRPIPIRILYARRILQSASAKRAKRRN